MFKRILLAATLLSSGAIVQEVAAQQVDVNGKDFLSGAGDARLAEIAKQAASQGKHLVVTAPDYWQSKVAAKLHAGASNVDVQMKEGFFENVLVRVEDGRAAAAAAKADTAAVDAKAAAAKSDAAKAEAARAEATRLETARAESERAEAARAQAAREQADRAEAARIEAQKAEAARAEAAKAEAARAEAAKAVAAKAAAEKAAADKIAATKKTMEQNVNGGHAAEGTVSVAQLQKDDQIFIDGAIRGVVRRNGSRTQLFWLDGDLNLERVELLPLSDTHYKVVDTIRETANPILRTKGISGHLVANVPAPDSAERKSLEQQFADGRAVTESIAPSDLRASDVIHAGKSSALVVRLSGSTYLRYWLDGDLNLAQAGLLKQPGGAYKVISDTIR
jgi:hypothetical protein